MASTMAYAIQPGQSNNPNRLRHRRLRPNHISTSTSLFLLTSLLAFPPSSQAAYLGPTYCGPKPGTTPTALLPSTSAKKAGLKGYSSYNHLLFDLVAISTLYRHGQPIDPDKLLFKICPGSIIDLDSGTLPLGYLPVDVPKVTIQCGERGERGTRSDASSLNGRFVGIGGTGSGTGSAAGAGSACIIRGGGKRTPLSQTWNTEPNSNFKNGVAGIVGGGAGSLAQIYVYGKTAFEVTLRGLTFDNTPNAKEKEIFDSFVKEFGEEALGDDDAFGVSGETLDESQSNGEEAENSASSASSVTNSNPSGTADGSGGSSNAYDAFADLQQQNQDSGTLSGQSEEPLTGSAMGSDLDTWGGPSQLEAQNGVTGIGGGGNIDLDYMPSEEMDIASDNDNNSNGRGRRRLQQQTNAETESTKGIRPANRFAAIAVKGNGYGDDAGPRIITIDNCKFEYHRGYAVLVSPGIEEPDLPLAPEFDFQQQQQQQQGQQQQGQQQGQQQSSTGDSTSQNGNGDTSAGTDAATGSDASMVTDANTNADVTDPFGFSVGNEESSTTTTTATTDPWGFDAAGAGATYDPDTVNNLNLRRHRNRKLTRNLNLLDNGANFIPQNGHVTYYDNTASINYQDGRRVKIMNSEFTNNVVDDTHTAGLVTSAYSLTLTGCFFQSNSARTMVFVYNNDALVENTVFAENTVEVSTVIMSSPKDSKPLYNNLGEIEPTHLVERSCFLGSQVGMSNVLATDVATTGFGQRNNHATGTSFSWISSCEGGAAEQDGEECLESGMCDGTCIQFTEGKCLADRDGITGLYSAAMSTAWSVWAVGATIAVGFFTGLTFTL